ncbi:MAG: thioredoxin-disulfide reductase [Myxococcales bacterium]|nr:thioredoxin-disulfide reductase [Myxococcales bacterium]USN49822.1 MAG: thioredoxin-disulfide reductase [Myxococcales bacterium]
MDSTNKVHKVVIIGSGPAGYTAALYASRATLKPLLFKGSAPNLPGGQLMMTSEVENFPGFPKGLLGPELMEKFEQQAQRFGAQCIEKNIIEVDFSKRPYRLIAEDGEELLAHTVIIATGANARLLGIPLEKELISQGAGVSACATCDGAFYKDVDVAVVGGGDSAMEEALFLTRYARSVTLIHRSENFRASKIMVERCQSNSKIKWALNKNVVELVTTKKNPLGKEVLCSLKVQDAVTKETTLVEAEGLFVAIGHKPNTGLFSKYLALDAKGYIITRDKTSKTEVPGVFACGDVQDSVYRQAITAAGSGCMAAIDAERFLETHGL